MQYGHWTVTAQSGSQVDVRCRCGATARLSAIVVQAPRPPRCTRCGAQTVPLQQSVAVQSAEPEPEPAPAAAKPKPVTAQPRAKKPAYRKPNRKPRVALAGSVWGRLTVIAVAGVMRTVRCECGTIKDVPSGSLVIGYVRSCGCLARDTKTKYAVGKEVRGMIVVSIDERRLQMRCTRCDKLHDVARSYAFACRCSCRA